LARSIDIELDRSIIGTVGLADASVSISIQPCWTVEHTNLILNICETAIAYRYTCLRHVVSIVVIRTGLRSHTVTSR